MRLDDAAADGQAEPAAAAGTRPALLDAVEAFEQPLELVIRNARSAVLDDQAQSDILPL